MFLILAIYFLVVYTTRILHAVPPAACFARFRSEDCGGRPKPVMYYWPSGSRCEVGLWRGCVPNINMFPDEYECIATCIFSVRAAPSDYHSFNSIEDDYKDATEDATDRTIPSNDTTGNTTDVTDGADSNSTDVSSTTQAEGTYTNATEKVTPEGGGDDVTEAEGNEETETKEPEEPAPEEPEEPEKPA